MKPGSSVTVRPARHFSGSLRLPGDKSISHRYAMLASLAEGKSRFENFSTGADCATTLSCMQQLGVNWVRTDEGANVIEVEGRGPTLTAPSSALDCGNSGSTMRMLSGIVAGQSFTSEMIGDEDAETPFESLRDKNLLRQMDGLLDVLDQREKRIISQRFGLSGGKPKTLEDIGKNFGVTRERIRQLQNIALAKLRRALSKKEDPAGLLAAA